MGITADDISLTLCEPREKAFTRAGWWFELKLDGFRLLAAKQNGQARLVFRRGREATDYFPEIAAAVLALPLDDLIIDGELVIQDAGGRPIFQKLLKRSTLKHQRDIDAMARELPAVFFGFDLLSFDGRDLRGLPLRERKKLLQSVLPKDGRLRYLDHVEEQGEALLELVRQQKLEGVVAKRADAPYRGERCDDWLKIALTRIADFAVVGYARDQGSLHLAVHDQHGFAYAGRVGAGYNPTKAKAVLAVLQSSHRSTPAFRGTPDVDRDDVWVEPKLVAEIRYKQWPEAMAIREPVFVRFRDDKLAHECFPPADAILPSPASAARPAMAQAQVKLSNPAKIFYPDDQLTKQHLFDYYRAVSPWLLPYLRDRPLMLTRYPDGIGGKNFFQKAKPKTAPEWIRTIAVRNEEEERELDQIVCDDLRTLEWIANMGTIPLHLPSARVAALDRPDWCVIDFDPKQAPFAWVVTLANSLHALCEKAGLPTYVKTSGSSGLHVMIPLGGRCDHRTACQLAEVLTMLLEAKHRDIATRERVIVKRGNRVYLDDGQNGAGRLIAAPFCLRPFASAPVSMPLHWAEVTEALHPRQFGLTAAIARLESMGDPMIDLLGEGVALEPVLVRLSEMLTPLRSP